MKDLELAEEQKKGIFQSRYNVTQLRKQVSGILLTERNQKENLTKQSEQTLF